MKHVKIVATLSIMIALILASCDIGMNTADSSLKARSLVSNPLGADTLVNVAASASHPYLLPGSDPVSFQVMAGQHILVGTASYSVSVETDPAGLYRAYLNAKLETRDGWTLGKLHFGVWTKDQFLSLWNPTLDASGNIVNFKLIPGRFPHHSPDLDPLVTTEYSFKVDITDLLPGTLDGTVNLYLALHAETHLVSNASIVQSETAWAGGYQNGKGNWAMYELLSFGYEKILAPEPTFSINYVGAESAFAGGDASATDFRNNSVFNFSRWGWTNAVPYGTSRRIPVYAGAGQSDPTKGKAVGFVDISNANGSLSVSVKLSAVDIEYVAPNGEGGIARNIPLKASAFHVYAGRDLFPSVKTGKTKTWTVSPGQYGKAISFEPTRFGSDPSYATVYSVSYPSTTSQNVIVHGVVYFPEVVFLAE